MKIQTVTHARRGPDSKPIKTYKLRYEETVRDPKTGQPLRGADGSIRKRSRSETYPTREAADNRRREIENERAATGTIVGREARQEPFGTFAAGWLASMEIRVQRGRLKQRTLDEYRRIVETYLLPRFAAVAIGAITPHDAERFAADLVSGAHLPGQTAKPLAPATFKHVWSAFGRVMGYATRKRAIVVNPLDNTEVEGGYAVGDEDGFTPHPLTAEQVAAVVQHITVDQQQPVFGLAVEFLAYSGLRAAEFAGLEIADLDLDAGTVRVARTKRRVKGAWTTGTPKSRRSRRTVPLDGWLVERMREYLSTHPRRDEPTAPLFPNRRKGGDTRPGPDGRIPPRPLDWESPVEPGSLYSGFFQRALKAAGLPVTTPARGDAPAVAGVRLHDLRHTFAVLSLSAGEHYMQVSQWLGHGTFTITLNVYGGYIPQHEGGKKAPLARPTTPPAPSPSVEAPAPSNVISLASRRKTG